jgi:hypothetical protein
MDKKDMLKWGALFAAFLVVWFLWRSRTASPVPVPVQNAATPTNVKFFAPYYSGVPNADNPPGFQFNGGTVNVNVNAGAYGKLNNEYIPMFGFVGVTAVGA